MRSMVFGRPDVFAIETMTEPELTPPSAVWGRMRVWCAGHPLGDFSEEYCALYGSYIGFKALLGQLPALWLEEFDGLSTEELWRRMDCALYGLQEGDESNDDRTIEEIKQDVTRYGVFDFLTNWGEQFDRAGKLFIFGTITEEVWIVGRIVSTDRITLLKAPLADVLSAVGAFVLWFDHEATRLERPVN